MKITLGPILYEWKKDDVTRFYDDVVETSVDTVCIGEVMCSNRRSFSVESAARIGEKLEKAGKKVVVSTLAVVSNEKDLGLVRDLLSLPFAVEANDMSIFGIVETVGLKKEIIAGPHLETYNKDAVMFLKGLGVNKVSFPVELSASSVKDAVEGTGVEAEVFAFGTPPLAFSWRCYTCRAEGITKDECRNDCVKYPDGIEIKTLKGSEVFSINGTSVMGQRPVSLHRIVPELKECGVVSLRLSPCSLNMKRTIEIFRECAAGRSGEDAESELKELHKTEFTDGYMFSKAGKDFFGEGRAKLSA